MARIIPLVLLFLVLSPGTTLRGQEPSAPRRVATVTAGIGNNMGWVGLQGEKYFTQDRLSAFLGVGYTPSIDLGDPSGLTFALGARGYTSGIKHRGFLALSVSQLFTENGGGEDPSRLYGPGIELGYQFASRGGFTLMAGVGVGYAPGMPDGQSAVASMIDLGLGYTWRR